MKNVLFIPLLLLSLLASPSWGQGMFKGMADLEGDDYASALRKAEQGDVYAQFYLGIMHKGGMNIPQNDEKSDKWFKSAIETSRLAAEKGDAEAQIFLGFMYSLDAPLAVPQDYKVTMKWYRLAAEQGYAGAQSNLGVPNKNSLIINFHTA